MEKVGDSTSAVDAQTSSSSLLVFPRTDTSELPSMAGGKECVEVEVEDVVMEDAVVEELRCKMLRARRAMKSDVE